VAAGPRPDSITDLSEGLLVDRPVFIVTASGGTYGGDVEQRDFHLEQFLGLVWFRDVRRIDAAGLAFDPSATDRAAERLHDEVAAFVRAA
jgi:FMN-dependent NADH-azoreductase